MEPTSSLSVVVKSTPVKNLSSADSVKTAHGKKFSNRAPSKQLSNGASMEIKSDTRPRSLTAATFSTISSPRGSNRQGPFLIDFDRKQEVNVDVEKSRGAAKARSKNRPTYVPPHRRGDHQDQVVTTSGEESGKVVQSSLEQSSDRFPNKTTDLNLVHKAAMLKKELPVVESLQAVLNLDPDDDDDGGDPDDDAVAENIKFQKKPSQTGSNVSTETVSGLKSIIEEKVRLGVW